MLICKDCVELLGIDSGANVGTITECPVCKEKKREFVHVRETDVLAYILRVIRESVVNRKRSRMTRKVEEQQQEQQEQKQAE